MANYNITLTNADINSGTSVVLFGSNFNTSLKKNVEAKPLVANTTYRLPQGTNLGIAPPIIVVYGSIDIDMYADDTALWGNTGVTLSGVSNCITLGMLYLLWKTQLPIQLTIHFGNPSLQKSYYNHQLTSNVITVLLNGISITPVESEGNHFVAYSLEFVEVKPD
jgi:hypothetical protein